VTQNQTDAGRWRALTLLATATVLAMATWFSASAVVPQLRVRWELGPSAGAWLTIAVQIGFVIGAVVSALLTLPDRFPPRRVILGGALLAAAANLGLLAVDGVGGAIVLRAVTGAALAAVYPPGMKAMAAWFRRDRGLALGVMVGALTLGSALPHLVNGLGGLSVEVVIITTSLLTVGGGVLAQTVRPGPFPFPSAPFRPRQIFDVLRHRPTRLATLGYVGHMWELYALWAWIVVFLSRAFEKDAVTWQAAAPLGAFAVIGIGALGCVAGGRIADRTTRERATRISLATSGTSAALIGLTFGGPWWVVLAVALVWGFWVVADSAQFSTIVTEVADQRFVGTALTVQTALGFALTVITIWLIPVVERAVTWRWAFLLLVPGPIVGYLAMGRLARLPAQASSDASDVAAA
jgi:MFS family permease